MDTKRSNFSKSLTSIATTAGVSVSTVSKVLNGRSDVAPETRERVARLLRGQGYQVATRAGIGVVDLLIGTLDSPWADELIRGAVTAADETEISVIVSRVTSDEELRRWLKVASARGTLGALSVLRQPGATMLAAMKRAHVPLVVIDPPTEPAQPAGTRAAADSGSTGAGQAVRSVGTTNWQGGLTIARHLIELGHRRIAIISGPHELWSCHARFDGYRSALRRAGVPADESLMRTGGLSAQDGRALAGELLDLPQPPTAIVCGNDAQAFGVLQALGERGLRCPDDVSVTGFDDVPIATWATPPLTTIHQPLAAMAATAFWMLTRAADAAGVQPRHLELETTLVIRDSTAPPRRV
jgi:DNA-binding LacI/PurR family transcriptional regulator